MEREKLLAKNTIVYLLGNIISKIISFLLLPVYTYYLSQSDMGTFDIIFTSVSLILPIITLSIITAVFRFLLESEDDVSTNRIITNGLFIVFWGIVLSFIPYILIANTLNLQNRYLILFLLISTILDYSWKYITRALQKNLIYAISGIISSITIGVSGILFIVIWDMGLKGILLSYSLAPLLSFLFIELNLKVISKIKLNLINKKTINEMLRYSFPLMPNEILWWFILSSNRYIINIFLGINENGIFSVSSKFPSLMSSINQLFDMAWQESAVLEYSSEDKNAFYSKIFDIFMRMQFSFLFLLLPLIYLYITFFVNKSYVSTINYIPFLLIGTIFKAFALFYGSGYISAKDTKYYFITTLMAAIVNIFLSIVLIKKIGLYSVSIANTVSFLVLWITIIITTRKFFSIKINYWLLILLGLLTIVFIIGYYMNNALINVVLFLAAIILSILINKVLLKRVFIFIKKKYISSIKKDS